MPSMPTVLTSADREEVIQLVSNTPVSRSPVDIYHWVSQLVTALLTYVTYFMDNNIDHSEDLRCHINQVVTCLINAKGRVDALKKQPNNSWL